MRIGDAKNLSYRRWGWTNLDAADVVTLNQALDELVEPPQPH